MNTKYFNGLLVLICSLFVSSKTTAAELTYENGKLYVPKISSKAMRKLRKQAESLSAGVIPEDAQAGIWFDGSVEKALPIDEFGQPSWLVRVNHIFVGQNQITGPEIKIRSATAKRGGCTLQEGTDYRILAVNFKQLLSGGPDDPYAWRGSVVPLSQLKQINQ